MREKHKILILALIALFFLSMIPVLADEADLTANVLDPPVADAGGPYSGEEGKPITFDGTGSYDPDGTIETFAWDWGVSIPIEVSTAEPTHTYSESGSYTVTLTVTDNDGLTHSDTANVEISEYKPPSPPPSSGGGGGGGSGSANDPPVADAGPNRTVYVDVVIHLSATGSHDPDGTIEVYHWFFGDGGYKSGVKVKHVYEEAGVYNASLTVVDNYGATGIDSCIVTVLSLPTPLAELNFENIPANSTGYVFNASSWAYTKVKMNTTDTVTVTVIKYETNPHPGDPMPGESVPNYADVFVSDPSAVVWPIYVEMSYTDEEIEGLVEESLGIYYWMDGEWRRCSDTGVKAERNVVWAYMTEEEAAGSPILVGGETAPRPAEFVVSYLFVLPNEVEEGENVTFGVWIINVGETEGTYTVEFKVRRLDRDTLWDQETIDIQNVTVAADRSHQVRAYYDTRSVGADVAVRTYQVSVGDLTETFIVQGRSLPVTPKPAEFEFSNLRIFYPGVMPPEVERGQTVTVTVSIDVTNFGEEMGGCNVGLKVNGEVVDSVDIQPFGGGVTVTQLFKLTRGEGTYEVELEGMIDSFTVLPPPEALPFWMQPVYIAGILALIIAASAILYAYRKGLIPLPSSLKRKVDYSLMRRRHF